MRPFGKEGTPCEHAACSLPSPLECSRSASPCPPRRTSGTTTATITVTGGSLSITVPTDAGNLGSQANTVCGGTISGPLGQVQVTDARSAAAGSGWVASVISTAFTPPAGPAIAASAVSYSAGTITKVGTATYTANNPGNLTGVDRRGHGDRDHRGQLRHVEPDDHRDRAGRHGRRRLLRDDHPLRCLAGA